MSRFQILGGGRAPFKRRCLRRTSSYTNFYDTIKALGTQPIRISEIEQEARKHFDIRDRCEGLMVDLSKKVRNGS